MKAIAGILLTVLLFGCVATKDRKAVGRVLAKPALREQVYEVALGLHPVNTIQIVTPGKDSIVYKHDTLKIVKDSLIRIACPGINIDSLKNVLTDTVIEIHYQLPTVLTVQDTNVVRRLDLMTEKFNNLSGASVQKDLQITTLKKDLGKWRLWSIVAGFFLLAVIGFLIYLLIRK